MLAEAWWHRGERDRCFAHLARAEEIVGDQEPSAAKARVLSQVARYRAIAGDAEPAISAGQEALNIAEELGLDELRAQALNNIAIARMNVGDFSGSMSGLEQSIEIAQAINSPEAARGYNNLSVLKWMAAGDAAEALRLRRESVRAAERLGDPGRTRFFRSSLVIHLYFDGRWDEAVHLAGELIEEATQEPHLGESIARERRAVVRHARGDDAGAIDDIHRAVDIARPARDPQMVLPTLTTWLRLAAEHELWDEAELAAGELQHELSETSSPFAVLVLEALWVARRSGCAESLRRVVEMSSPVWTDAGMAVLDERYADAARAFHEMGDVADEAYARLRTGESHEVERALAFYRSVGATRYIREAEALLPLS